MKLKEFILYLIVLIFTLNACRKTEETREIKGLEYFPIKIGDVKYYDVDSFFFDPFFNTTDSVKRVLKEEVVEKIANEDKDTVYRIELSIYNKTLSKWVVFQSFTRNIDGNYAIETKDNTKEVKIIFPISTYKTRGSTYVWNVNMFNQLDAKYIKFNKVFTPYTIGTETYPNTINIQLNKTLTGVVNDIREEVYAKDIGLIYKHIDVSDYLSFSDTFIRSGYEIFVKLKK
ncbi:MAG: hypothetical protein Q8K70_11110 [Bacteroidota bacterium]|nr:hypothetical protein [Bacteroidota bacterium]